VNRLTTAIRNRKFADEFASRIVDVNSVTYTSIDISIGVGMDPIGKAVVTVGEQLSISKSLTISRYIVSVYRCRVREVVLEGVQFNSMVQERFISLSLYLVWECVRSSVRHVYVLPIWTEFNAIGCDEVVGYGLNNASVELEPIDLRTDHLGRSINTYSRHGLAMGHH
jgi:hypothetical protein